MERNTQTTLGQLRDGDRFYFSSDHKKVSWEVKEKAGATQVLINNPNRPTRFPIPKNKNLAVVFLRHTVPVPGDECQVEELSPGAMFYFPDDVITEYIVSDREGSFIRCLGPTGSQPFPPNTPVILVRNAPEVTR